MTPCCFILLFVLLSYDAQAAFVRNTNDVVYFSDRMENLVKKKCLKNADQARCNEALDGLHHFIHCWQLQLPKKKLAGEALYDYCMENAKNFSSYLETFVEKLTPCLDPQEKYLEQFILASYGDHNHYFCKSLAEKDADNCYTKFMEHPETDPLVACYKTSKVFGYISTLDVITEPELCEDLSNIHACYEEMFDEHCPNSTNLRNLRLVLIKQALENCSK